MSGLELLTEKWNYWFDLLDINKDGVLTTADWNKGAEILVQGNGLTGDLSDRAHAGFVRFGELLLGGGELKGHIAVTKEEFVTNMSHFYEKDRKAAYKYVRDSVVVILETADIDQDGYITMKEFLNLARAFGLPEETGQSLFHLLRGEDTDVFPVKEGIDYWTGVWIGDDDRNHWTQTLEAFK